MDDEADVDLFAAGDLARHDDLALGRHDLAGHAGRTVFAEAGVQDAVCDIVAELIRVTRAHAFCCFVSGHFIFLSERSKAAPSHHLADWLRCTRRCSFLLRSEISPATVCWSGS